ncbi:N-acetyltransferase [Alphaproteobacteria bacterium KMM 3653]|uniref:N-acetyltransferase n=1 Tax=Harenicola maris TaxID=2841044 RepID=A0AAP2CU98_9RHOB|nr:N-acetyltransferase [Harenicola maris]
MKIREALPADEAAIAALTAAAFAPMKFSDGTEAGIPAALRAAGDLTLSLVACEGEEVIANVIFSPVRFASDTPDWYALGPVSVTPTLQRRGIGRGLIGEGLRQLRAMGAAGCVLTGNPAVYGSSGFVETGLMRDGETPSRNILSQRFKGPEPFGEITFHPAFYG